MPNRFAGNAARSRFLAACLAPAAVAPWLRTALGWRFTGWDFPVSYIAAKLPLKLLYNRAAVAQYWQQYLEPAGVPHWAAYVRPPVFALFLRPLAALPYTPAMWTWLAACFGAYLLSVILLIRRFQLPPLLLPAFLLFFPAMQGIVQGNDATLFLLPLVAGLLLLEKGYDAAAGLCLVLCLCKFNLVLLAPAMLFLQHRRKALTVFSAGAILVAGVSFLMIPLHEYINAIVQTQAQTVAFYPVGWRGATDALGCQWAYPWLAAITLAACLWLMRHLPIVDAFAVAITGSLMIPPYICWYDSALLALAIAAVWARAGGLVRMVCALVLVAIPFWLIGGGGFTGHAGGYMHIGVEAAILGYYVNAVWGAAWRRDVVQFQELRARMTPSRPRAA